jgi:hypothetical protein
MILRHQLNFHDCSLTAAIQRLQYRAIEAD